MSMTAQGPDVIAKRLYQHRNVHQPLSDPVELDEAAIRRYQTDGFIAIENVFTPQEVNSAMEGIASLIAVGNPDVISFEPSVDVSTLSPFHREAAVRKCMFFVRHEPRLAAVSRQRKLMDIVQRLIGSEVVLLQDMALLKPPMIGREKPWHQDCAYFSYGPPDLVIGTWTALDRATLDNGCMHLIPGSHQQGARPHYHDRDCQLPDETVDTEHVLAVPLSPGGVLFFHGLLHHGTPPNRSSERRRALQFHYRSVNATPMTHEEHRLLFHDHEGWAGCHDPTFRTPVRKMPN